MWQSSSGVISESNKSRHRTIYTTRKQADNNSENTKLRIESDSNFTRKWPGVTVGDKVRHLLMRNSKHKTLNPRFSRAVLTIASITPIGLDV